MNEPLFADRADAGRRLAGELRDYAGRDDLIVLALPRGGVPVAHEVARRLGAPLDVLLVRKLGAPGQPELAIGAIASGGIIVLNDQVIEALEVDDEQIERARSEELVELERRERVFRGDAPYPDLRGKTVILIDDGLATGASMRAAIAGVATLDPTAIVVAVPVAARETCDELRGKVDRVVCLETPVPFRGVGLWYDDFRQTTDEEVRELLARSRNAAPAAGRPAATGSIDRKNRG